MISIIIPLFNREAAIKRTLESILNQQDVDFEVIVVNDGSADNSLQSAQEYKEAFAERGRRYLVVNQENKGAPAARNRGLAEAKGDYLLFCDADVVLNTDALAEMRKALQENGRASYAYASFLWGSKLFRLMPFDEKKLKQMPYINSISLIRREHFPASGWDESLKKFQDWDLWLTMLAQGHTGVWVDRVLFQIEPGGVYSSWLPSFAYKVFPFLPAVKKYKQAMKIIKEKHEL